MTKVNAGRGLAGGFRIKIRHGKSKPARIVLSYSVDEKLFEEIKVLHIKPSVVIDRELRREVRRRKEELRSKTKRQLVNRFSGEVLSTV